MRTKSDFLSFLVVFLVTLGHELSDCFAQSGLPCTHGAELDTQSGQTCPILLPSWCLQSRKSAKNRSRVNLNSPEMVPKMPTNGSQ